VEAHGVKVQNEHFIATLNKWIDIENELGYLTIPKELCANKPTRLGGPFGVDQILLE
jgi:hypothetical protein